MALLVIAKRFSDDFWAKFWAELSPFTNPVHEPGSRTWFTSLAIIVPAIVGWLTQKQLARDLTSGAVK